VANEHTVTVEVSHPGNCRTSISELKPLSKDLINNSTRSPTPSMEDAVYGTIPFSRESLSAPLWDVFSLPRSRAPPHESPATFPEAPAQARCSHSTLLIQSHLPDRAMAHVKTNILQVTEWCEAKSPHKTASLKKLFHRTQRIEFPSEVEARSIVLQ